jgi:hypothetical protein
MTDMSAGKFKLGISICVAVGMLAPAAAKAQSTFRFYVGAAPTTYGISFDQDTPSALKKGKTVKSSYTATSAGFSWITPIGFYMDLSGQKSPGSATHDLWASLTNQPQKFSRTDAQLTLGYVRAFNSGVSVSGFGGYKYGHTELAAPRAIAGWSKDIFDTRGLFVGVGGGFPMLAGQVSVSVAGAYMNGEWKDDQAPPFVQSADYTFGYSIGAGYTYKFTPAFGVTVDARYQQYNYSFNAYSVTLTAYEIREKIAGGGVRLSYQF